MQIDNKGSYTIITPSETKASLFFDVFSKKKDALKKEHIVLDFLQNINTVLEDILLFLNIAIDCRKNGTSFVIVCIGIPIDDIPDEITVVPTIPEAIDILEIDEIERDLMNF
jgi:hypothetical protein